jgi:hypothetical protein
MCVQNQSLILGTFAKLQEVTIGSVMSVCLSVCLSVSPSVRPSVRLSVYVQQLGPHWTDFLEI